LSFAALSAYFAPMYRILFVDGDAPLRERVGEYLRGRGYDVACVATAEGALEAMEGCGFDLIVTELKLPGRLNGTRVLAHHHRLFPDRARILHTTLSSDQLRKVCAYLKTHCLPKPASLDDMLAAISSLLAGAEAPGRSPWP
jgi:CheY-like chemotaxis protein